MFRNVLSVLSVPCSAGRCVRPCVPHWYWSGNLRNAKALPGKEFGTLFCILRYVQSVTVRPVRSIARRLVVAGLLGRASAPRQEPLGRLLPCWYSGPYKSRRLGLPAAQGVGPVRLKALHVFVRLVPLSVPYRTLCSPVRSLLRRLVKVAGGCASILKLA